MDCIVRELKNSGANGSDSIPAFILKDAYIIWHREILHLTNLSLCTGIFPTCLKTTKILPVVKKGKAPNQPSSFRPISSLNMLAKILERAGFDQLQTHCDINNIICEEQHGGRARHSTTTCLIETQEDIQKAKDSKLKCALLGIDLSGAYEFCSHNVIDQQLRLTGASEHARGWMLSFLGDRFQFVEVEGIRSMILPSLKMGLCQGGRSSGILFAIHTNQLPKMALAGPMENKFPKSKKQPRRSVTIKQFVDDTNAIVAAPSFKQLELLIQVTYNNLESHLTSLGMAINAENTQLMVLHPDQEGRMIQLTAGERQISHQPTIKILGYTFSDDLKADHYIWKGEDNLTRSIRIKVSMLRVLKPYMETKQLFNIANMIINSQIAYVAPLWALAGVTNLTKIQSAQTRAARQINWTKGSGLIAKPHRQDLLEEIGWLNATQISQMAIIQLVKKASTNVAPEGINKMFMKSDDNKKRTKYQHLIHTINTKKRLSKNIIDYGRKAFNQLPIELRKDNMKKMHFKRELKLYIKDHFHLTRH